MCDCWELTCRNCFPKFTTEEMIAIDEVRWENIGLAVKLLFQNGYPHYNSCR